MSTPSFSKAILILFSPFFRLRPLAETVFHWLWPPVEGNEMLDN